MSADPCADTPGFSTSTPDRAQVLQDLIDSRFSCRDFVDKQVPRETIELMFTLAQKSASWCNTQPWEVIVTSGTETERFRHDLMASIMAGGEVSDTTTDFEGPAGYFGRYAERRREAGWALYEAVGVERGDRAASARQSLRNFELFGAPHVAIITTNADHNVYGALDAGVYLGNLLLVAESLGLGAIAQAALATQGTFIREFFDIPEDRKILVGMSFGYPNRSAAANSFRTRRADLTDVVRWRG